MSKANKAELERIKKNPGHLAYVADQTEEMCLEAVTRNGLSLYYAKVQTDNVQKQAIQQNPHSLTFIEKQSDEICKLAVAEDGMTLQFVNNKTPEICLLAVKQNGSAIRFVPNNLWTEDLLIAAVTQDSSVLQLIENQTEAICIAAIENNPACFPYIKNQTTEIIKTLVNKNESNMLPVFLDLKKFKLHTLQNIETGEIINLNVTTDNTKNPQNQLPSPNNHNLVYFEDVRKNKRMYINNALNIQTEIEKYITQRYGKKCLEKALLYNTAKSTPEQIRLDDTFDDGVFFIKNSETSYDMYKKTTTYKTGWFYGTSRFSTIEKIRIYGVIEQE